MRNVRTKMVAVMNRGNWNHPKIIEKIPEKKYLESTGSRNCRKQQYCAQHTYCGKCSCRSTKRVSWEITLHVTLL
jgi:hypothetical protein